MDPKFESFPDIKKLGTAVLFITQKIHGANAQIFIYRDYKVLETVKADAKIEEYQDTYPGVELGLELYDPSNSLLVERFTNLACGSRSQWVSPGKDNYGFDEMVYANKQAFIDTLGLGRHYGEWAGPGINSGEGLKTKTFVLFDHWKYPPERPLPPNTVVVPVLYSGPFDMAKVQECMDDLKANGSKLVPGFTRPEGCVVRIKGDRYKVVFNAEETAWKNGDPEYQKNKSREENKAAEKYAHLLQPIRLEKLLCRDEVYLTEYPKSMGKIVTDYFTDLIKEDQVQGTEVEIQGIRRSLGRTMFKFVQETVEKQQNANS